MIKKQLKNNRVYFIIIVVISASLIISGCNKNSQPVVQAPQIVAPQVVAKPVLKSNSSSLANSVVPVVSNQFDFSSKKDPFKPFAVVKASVSVDKNNITKQTKDSLPIHSFDVSQFKLIGIVASGKNVQAMVTDPNGKGYVIKTGMTIGKNEGKVIMISSNSLEVLEQFKDDNGRTRKETIKITLPRKQ